MSRAFSFDTPPWRTNLKFGPWCVIRELESGGMGTVYMVVHEESRPARRFALKAIRKEIAAERLSTRFEDERRLLASISHPHIVKFEDAGETTDGAPYIVMEYVEGQSLTDFCAEERLPLADRLRLFERVCRAVAYLHSRQPRPVVHRDLKPANIFVTGKRAPKLLDFGIAKSFTDERKTTLMGMRLFTPAYASPEQVLGSASGTAGDVYSLGNILYRLLTGRGPFGDVTGLGHEELARRMTSAPPPAPSLAPIGGMRAKYSQRLDAIVGKALQLMPSDRYPTARELADDLKHLLKTEVEG